MNATFQKARKHLSRKDARMKRLIARVGPCTLQPNPDHFGLLVRSIISQQISTKAALSIHMRLSAMVGRPVRPRAIMKTTDEELRSAGLSQGKMRSLRDLSEKCLDRQVRLKDLADLDDEAVIAQLIPVRGIGRWTAEMFLIFQLRRLDVWPVDDYGIRKGWALAHKLKDLPAPRVLQSDGDLFRPYRTIAAWYCWRAVDTVLPVTRDQ
jgi:DNA-3-methyladenine glycosylase II